MRILNLYAGIGGNRKLWGDEHEVTAVEYDQATADVYKSLFPNDTVVVGDAHEYLLKNYMNFDFIWASPPCPSHSDIRRCGVQKRQYDALYPDMSLYQEIILLKNFAPKETKFVIENVIPYYKPLIDPDVTINRHNYWCNFKIHSFEYDNGIKIDRVSANDTVFGFSVVGTEIKDKRKALRNMVDPDLGLHILNSAISYQPPMTIGLFA
jgi:DNA (cytosine-5)-methyltransferase 1